MKMEGLPIRLCHSQHFNLRFFFLIVFTTFRPCFTSLSQACTEPSKCRDQTFDVKNSGCGDPHALRLDCDHKVNMPLLNISGYQYYLLEPFGHRKEDPINSMRIVDRNMWGGACDPSTSNHTMELWSTPHFRISDEYINASLWGDCGEDLPTEAYYALECNKSWYYSKLSLATYCKSLVQLPVKKSEGDNQQLFGRINDGFTVIWNFSEGCEYCEWRKEICKSDAHNLMQFSCESLKPGESNAVNKTGIAPNNAGGSNTANKSVIALGSSMGTVALVIVVAVIYIVYVKKRKSPHSGGIGGDYSNYQRNDMEAGHIMNMMGSLPVFPYQELQKATSFFNERNELGDGGFGVVYLGKLDDGRAVAVKRLYQESSRTVEQFMNEVHILSSLCHPNLVRLYGCTSRQSPMLLLVYEFLPNGTLSDHLHGSRKNPTGLPWVTRLNIAIETAEALAYLHSMNPPILHRDVKSDNILLDEHFRAKVTDFGLSRLVPLNVSHITTAPQGTPGYVDPEYNECFQLTDKSDVYSLGVVLAEIVSAEVAVDIMRNRNEISLTNMATDKIRRGVLNELVDPDLRIERNEDVKVSVAAVAELAFECLAIEREGRPAMKEVVGRLIEIKEMLQESTESFSSVSSTPTSSLTSMQESWPGIASD